MINIGAIIPALTKTLRELAFNVEANSTKEGYRRGSIHIKVGSINSDNYMKNYRETNMSIELIYHPKKDDDMLELAIVQEKLLGRFVDNEVLEVDNMTVEIKDVEYIISDCDLLFNFDLFIFEEYEEKQAEKMEDLYIGGRLRNGD